MYIMKVLFVAVFNEKSTNNSQLYALQKSGCKVVPYDFKERAKVLGNDGRDNETIRKIKEEAADVVLFSKCKGMSVNVLKACQGVSLCCLWFMDPVNKHQWTGELLDKIRNCDVFVCDKKKAFRLGSDINPNTLRILEGYDETVDTPYDLKKDIEVSFIGNPYDKRSEMCSLVSACVISDAYGTEHAKAVSRSKINLNFCNEGCASDRVYKVLAARGFLISDDWSGREEIFEDGKHLVIFNGAKDLQDKVKYYLKNDLERDRISNEGLSKVQKYTRSAWARNIVDAWRKLT